MPTETVSFVAIEFEDTLTSAVFTTDIAKTDTPTQYLTPNPGSIRRGRILEIGYRLNPTAAETYTLMVFEAADAGDYESNSHMLYESAAARADDTDYRVSCDLAFRLELTGRIYIATDWTGAPGNTTGYIRISGVAYF